MSLRWISSMLSGFKEEQDAYKGIAMTVINGVHVTRMEATYLPTGGSIAVSNQNSAIPRTVSNNC